MNRYDVEREMLRDKEVLRFKKIIESKDRTINRLRIDLDTEKQFTKKLTDERNNKNE